MRKKYILIMIIILLVVLAFTTPSSSKYDTYLKSYYGIDCEVMIERCVNTKMDKRTDVIHNYLFFMVAETFIFGNEDNNIRSIGLFNHFFIVDNNLHSQKLKMKR